MEPAKDSDNSKSSKSSSKATSVRRTRRQGEAINSDAIPSKDQGVTIISIVPKADVGSTVQSGVENQEIGATGDGKATISLGKRKAGDAGIDNENLVPTRVVQQKVTHDALDGSAAPSVGKAILQSMEMTISEQEGDISGSPTVDGSASDVEAEITKDDINSEAEELDSKGKSAEIDWPASPLTGSVMHESLQAKALKDTYDGLPILRPAQLTPANDTETLTGFFDFQLWKFMLEGGSDTSKRIKQAVIFDIDGAYFNPARADPASVAIGTIAGTRYLVCPSRPSSCMMAITTGCSISSELRTGRVNTYNADKNTISKRVTVIPHSQEFERMVAFLGMAFGFDTMKALCYSDFSLTFSTRTAPIEGPVPRSTNMHLHNFLARTSPSSSLSPAVARGQGGVTHIRSSLGPHEDVPIYDARNVNFDLKEDLKTLRGLPLFEGGRQEVPDGSCVSVGHTVGIFKNKDGEQSLTLNIHWVIIWGVPKKRY